MISAIDLGYGAVKVYRADGYGVLPSHVATNGRDIVHRVTVQRQERPPLKISMAEGEFYVGDGAHDWGRPIVNLDFDRFLGTPEMKALLYGALSLYSTSTRGESTSLVVGMPLEFLTGDVETIRDKVKQVKKWLKGAHTWHAGETSCFAQFDEVSITSQADGTLFDWFLDDDGRMIPARKPEYKKEVGILNVGMNTVDLLVVQAGKTRQRFTAGDTRGVRRLLDLCNGDGLYTLGELDRMLRTGELDTSTGLNIWGREVLGFVERQWGKSFKRFARVICAGGGSILLREQLQRRFGGKIVVPDDPVIAVARGLFKYARMRQARRRS